MFFDQTVGRDRALAGYRLQGALGVVTVRPRIALSQRVGCDRISLRADLMKSKIAPNGPNPGNVG